MLTEWEQIRIPKELFDEATKVIREKGFWVNEQDFVREAVREKITKIQAEA